MDAFFGDLATALGSEQDDETRALPGDSYVVAVWL